MSASRLRELERAVPRCRRCPRLARNLDALRREHPDWWARPVPGLGDPRAWCVVVGLAPGRSGAGRTGRPFQGDVSGAWLYGSLAAEGLWDGKRLHGAFIANAVKCVPPANRPTGGEIAACGDAWLGCELGALERARVVVALGGIAARAVLRVWGATPLSAHPFSHGALHRIPGRPALLCSYHPSPQNTNTGRLSRAMWSGLWRRTRRFRPGASAPGRGGAT